MQPNPSTAIPGEQPSNPIRVCKNCGTKLQSNNRNGYCRLHRHLYRPKGKFKIIVAYKARHSLAEVAELTQGNVHKVNRGIKKRR